MNDPGSKPIFARSVLWSILFGLIIVAGLFSGAQIAHADGFGNSDVAPGQSCMQEAYGDDLGCNANDIQIANVTNLTIDDDGCTYPGDTVTFTADFEVLLTAQARYDIGIWFAEDGDPNGDGALTGACTAVTPAYAPEPDWLDLDGTSDDDPGGVIQDTCGDIDADHNPLTPTVTLTVKCVDSDGNGQADVPNCTSWRQPGANELCTSPTQAVPGGPSKCRCDDGFGIPITVPGLIIVEKVALDVDGTPLPGDTTKFDFSITGPDTDLPDLFQLSAADSPHTSPGLDPINPYDVTEDSKTGWNLVSATCVSDQDNADQDPNLGSILVGNGETLTCTYTNQKAVAPPDISVVKTADPTSLNEPGGDVTFHVQVINSSDSDATLDSLVDSIHGDLNGLGACSVPQPLPASGGSYSCSFTANVSGDPDYVETDIITASASNDAGSDEASDDATVTITDTPSSIVVEKTADPTSVPEPGGNVTYNFVVRNTSTVDSVTIDTLDDTIYGDLDGQNDCSVPQTIAAGNSYSCSITVPVSGDPDDTITNVVTASGVDDDGNPVSDDDDAIVTITDTPSSIVVEKTADPTSVPEPGGNVTYNFVVRNTSTVDSVTINSMIDSIYGNLNTQGNCQTPQTIPAGGSYDCSITKFVSDDVGEAVTNVVTASGVDDDGNPVSGDADAVVTIDDLSPTMRVRKSADPTNVNEPGDDVTFTVVVENNSVSSDPLTINSLVDDIHGDLNDQGDCEVPQTIAPGSNYTCRFTAFVAGNGGHSETDIVTASGTDDEGNPVEDSDDATVTIGDVDPLIDVDKTADPMSVLEPGGEVTFEVVVNNNSNTSDPVTINSLTDDIHGDLNGQGNCAVPQTIPAGNSYTCSFTAFVAGDGGGSETDTVTASGADDEGTPVTDSDDATVTIDDALPSISVDKSADPTRVDEPGDDVTFTVVVTNDSASTDPITLNSLTDDIYGDLNGQGDCAVPQTIAPGSSYTCRFTVFVSGNAGDSETDTVTASGTDDEGNPVEETDDATVVIDDVPSSIEMVKSADPTSMPSYGADVVYTFTVINRSPADEVTIDSLTDTVFGDLDGQGNCSLPQTIGVGGRYSCEIEVFLSGSSDEPHYNVVTASGEDDDGNPVEDTDDETINFVDISILLTESYAITDLDEDGTPTRRACYWIRASQRPSSPITVSTTRDPLKEIGINKKQVILDDSNWDSLSRLEHSNRVCVQPINDDVVEEEEINCGYKSDTIFGQPVITADNKRCGDHMAYIWHEITDGPPLWTNPGVEYKNTNGPDFDDDQRSIDVLIRDNDIPLVIITESYAVSDVDEDRSPNPKACYWLNLSSQPSTDVTLEISADAQVNTDKRSVTLTSANWNVRDLANDFNKVCIKAEDDPKDDGNPSSQECANNNSHIFGDGKTVGQVCGDHMGLVGHAIRTSDPIFGRADVGFVGNGPDTDDDPSTINVFVRDDEVAAVKVAPVALNMVEGDTDTVTVKLGSAPAQRVIIGEEKADNAETRSLQFNPDEWDSDKQLSLTFEENDLADGTHTERIRYRSESADSGYDGLVADLLVTVVDNDTPGVILTSSTLAVEEAGADVTYGMRLTTKPLAPVSVALVTDGQMVAIDNEVIFTADNWDSVQQVRVQANDDGVDEHGAHEVAIAHTVRSDDPGYDDITVGSVTANIVDNDQAGVYMTQPNSTELTESGGSTSYQVALMSEPVGIVRVTVATDDQVQSDVSSLVFDARNWNQPRTVTLTAVDDAIAEAATHVSFVNHSVGATDANYNGMTVDNVILTITDDDASGVLVSVTQVRVEEGGESATYALTLKSRPVAPVFVDIEADGQVTVSGNCFSEEDGAACVVIRPDAYGSVQTVTVRAVDDNQAESEEGAVHKTTLRHTVSSEDVNYDGSDVHSVEVSIVDNDKDIKFKNTLYLPVLLGINAH